MELEREREQERELELEQEQELEREQERELELEQEQELEREREQERELEQEQELELEREQEQERMSTPIQPYQIHGSKLALADIAAFCFGKKVKCEARRNYLEIINPTREVVSYARGRLGKSVRGKAA